MGKWVRFIPMRRPGFTHTHSQVPGYGQTQAGTRFPRTRPYSGIKYQVLYGKFSTDVPVRLILKTSIKIYLTHGLTHARPQPIMACGRGPPCPMHDSTKLNLLNIVGLVFFFKKKANSVRICKNLVHTTQAGRQFDEWTIVHAI